MVHNDFVWDLITHQPSIFYEPWVVNHPMGYMVDVTVRQHGSLFLVQREFSGE
jgi:hypothetical protein